MIQVLDKTFEVFIKSDEILAEVASLAKKVSTDFKGKDVIFIAVLNGSFMFASDFMKNVDISCDISFVKMSSYKGTQSTGRIDELIGLGVDVADKHVVFLEDIVDTGFTIDKIISLVESHSPASASICTLLYKPDAFKGVNKPHYVGFSIPNRFVVGYGLDYNEKGRNLDAIYQLAETEK